MDELQVSKRLRYFNHQFLTDLDFTDEQEYHLKRRRLHNRLLHTSGIAHGLDVERINAKSVTVKPGVAIDDLGQEIVLTRDQPVDVSTYPPGKLYLTISYFEQTTDPAKDDLATGDTGAQNTRWTEEPAISASPATSALPAHSIPLALITRSSEDGTLPLDAVDYAPRPAAGAGGSSMELLNIHLGKGGVDKADWVRMGLEAPRVAVVDGSLHIRTNKAAGLASGLTVSGAGAVFESGLSVTGGQVSFAGGTGTFPPTFANGLQVTGGQVSFAGGTGTFPPTFANGLQVTGGQVSFAGGTGTPPKFGNGLAVTGGQVSFAGGTGTFPPTFANGLQVTAGQVTFASGAGTTPPTFANGLQVTGGQVTFTGLSTQPPKFWTGFQVTSGQVVFTAGANTPTFANGFSVETGLAVFKGGLEVTSGLVSFKSGLQVTSGNVGIGTPDPKRHLHVQGTEVHSGGTEAGFSFSNRDAPNNGAFVQAPDKGQRWTWFAKSGNAQLWGSGIEALSVTPSGDLKTSGGYTCGGNIGWNSAGTIHAKGRLNIQADESMLLTAKEDVYIGYMPNFGFIPGGGFTGGGIGGIPGPGGIIPIPSPAKLVPNPAIRGNLWISGDFDALGSKSGYVVDKFVNRLGDALEQGDVVVVHSNGTSCHYGSRDQIPVPEVDLTEQAYDARVCGIVEAVYGEMAEVVSEDAGNEAPAVMAPRIFDGEERAEMDIASVQPGQVGGFVTLGAYRYCKVDADIAPIVPGDLLTTSPTKGHAQKVLDRALATGATIGKALDGLEKGKGTIPVLVNIH